MSNPLKVRAVLTTVTTISSGIYSLSMKPLGRVPRFKAGQFLHLAIDDYDPTGGFWPESRVFSIASKSGEAEIRIIYSVKGGYTRRMENELAVGRIIWLKLPYGEFIIDQEIGIGRDVVLVAGGTGISPFLPYLSELGQKENKLYNTSLYYGVRDSSMAVELDLLTNLARLDFIKMIFFSETTFFTDAVLKNISQERGRLDIMNIYNDSKGLVDPVFFLSGPPAMIKNFRDKLLDEGLKTSSIKIDEWE